MRKVIRVWPCARAGHGLPSRSVVASLGWGNLHYQGSAFRSGGVRAWIVIVARSAERGSTPSSFLYIMRYAITARAALDGQPSVNEFVLCTSSFMPLSLTVVGLGAW